MANFFGTNKLQDSINQANANRQGALDTGGNLNNYLNNQVNYYDNIKDGYRGQADTAYSDLAANPGYSSDQASEIRGNPNAAFNYYNPTQLSGDVAGNAADLQNQVGAYQGNLSDAAGNVGSRGAAAANDLSGALGGAAQKSAQDLANPSGTEAQWLGGTYSYLKNANDAANGTLGHDLNSAVDPSKLTVSDQFANAYKMTPEEQQNIKNVAGNTVQGQYQKLSDELDQRAAAEGNSSPAAIAAEKQALMRQGSIDAGNAMSSAELQANQAAAQRALTLQQTQLGANEDLATRQAQNAQSVYGANAGSAANLSNLEAAGIKDTIGNQMEGAKTSANLGYQAELQGGTAKLDAANLGSTYGYNAAQTGGAAGLDASKYSGAQRLSTDQANQATGQGLAVNADNTSSARGTQIANQSQGGQQKVRDYYTGQQGQSQQGSQTASGQAIQNLGTTYGAANQATNTAAQAGAAQDNKPSLFSQLAGAAIGVASHFDNGGVVTKPTMAIIGEHRPEMVVKLDGGDNPYSGSPYQSKQNAAMHEKVSGSKRFGRYGMEKAA